MSNAAGPATSTTIARSSPGSRATTSSARGRPRPPRAQARAGSHLAHAAVCAHPGGLRRLGPRAAREPSGRPGCRPETASFRAEDAQGCGGSRHAASPRRAEGGRRAPAGRWQGRCPSSPRRGRPERRRYADRSPAPRSGPVRRGGRRAPRARQAAPVAPRSAAAGRRQRRSLPSIHSSRASASLGLRPGPVRRSTTTWLTAAKRTPPTSSGRSNTTS